MTTPLPPTQSFERDVEALVAGRPVQIGRLTLTAPRGGRITLSDSAGRTSTWGTLREFEADLTKARAAQTDRQANST